MLQDLLNKENGSEGKTYEVSRRRHGLTVYYKLAYVVEIYNETYSNRLNQNDDLLYRVQAGCEEDQTVPS